jgi:uncharacterized repeat protein (TIGR03803 family)
MVIMHGDRVTIVSVALFLISAEIRAAEEGKMHKLRFLRTTFLLFMIWAAAATSSSATTKFHSLQSFDGTDGAEPYYMSLVQGIDGDLYGTTISGGANQDGTVFKITTKGKLSTLYSFCSVEDCTDGTSPKAGLIQGADGNFYGTTAAGGLNNGGTVFKITPKGKLTTLYSFCTLSSCADGNEPLGTLVQATDGNFYGTTYGGGASGFGTVFVITPEGALTTLHSFGGDCSIYPYAGLVQATNGDFYGTTDGYPYSYGSVYVITAGGQATTLYCFDVNESHPDDALVQGSNGNFYGTTSGGGANGDGTVFEMTPSGQPTFLHSFDNNDGSSPIAGLIQGTDGDFYGTTTHSASGCTNGCGTIFKITTGGTLTTLRRFDNTDGFLPYGGLTQATNGIFYGTTTYGGASNEGMVFSLSVGLDAFVESLLSSGSEGANVGILGQGFTSSSIVKFGGVTATTVKLTGSTFLTATVPAGALTGPITVSTGSTTLTSNKTFRVIPKITTFTPTSGPVGTTVTITGSGLAQTTTVTFGGVKATTFEVNSDAEVTADVPTGAKTGKIAITTPGGKAVSSASFTVD